MRWWFWAPALVCFLLSTSGSACERILAQLGIITQKIARAGGDLDGEVGRVLLAYSAQILDPELKDVLPAEKVIALLANPEMPDYQRVLGEAFQRFQDFPAEGPAKDRLLSSFRYVLEGKVPSKSIPERVEALQSGTREGLLRGLGEMSLAETLELLHGGDPLHPTPESLVGKYLAETGASQLVRGFTQVPNQYNAQVVGPQRLVVAVSPASFEAFSKYFMRPEMFSVHGHAFVSHHGKLTSYNHQGVEFRLPSRGYALPQVVLKTSEAQRFGLFLRFLVYELARGTGYTIANRAMHPWSVPGYVEPGGYLNCTHWIGNIPVGDRRVTEYTFPSNVNQPLVRSLRRYSSNEAVMTRVWKSPGHEQLSDILGIKEHNGLGNMASPGYVVHTLLGETPVERVPLVFYVVDDHKAPIAPQFLYTVEGAN